MPIVILVAVVIATAGAHILLKVGMNDVGEVGFERIKTPVRLAADLFTTPAILAAIPIYAASFAGWIFVLSRLDLSLAYPALALTYVMIPLAAWLVLHEEVTRMHWAGILIVVAGVSLIVRAGLS